MKITLVTETFLPFISGVSTSTNNIAESLSQRGHEVTVICPRPVIKSEFFPSEKKFRIVYIPSIEDSFFQGKSISPWPLPFLTMLKYIRKDNTDLVHIQETGFLGITAIFLAKTRKIPVVGMIHTSLRQLITLFSPFPFGRFFGHFIYFLYLFFYRFCDKVIVLTKDYSEFLTNKGFDKQLIVPNGIDTKLYTPNKKNKYKQKYFSFPSGKILFAYVGRLDIDKNLNILVESLKFVEDNVHLLMVGKGKEKNNLISLSRNLQIDHKISWFSISETEKLAVFYRSIDIFVIPSLVENMSLSLLEALSSGLPVIAADIPSMSTLVKSNRNGFLVSPPYGSRSFAEKINLLASDSFLRKKMGSESRKIGLSYDQKKMIDKMEKLYCDLTNLKNK